MSNTLLKIVCEVANRLNINPQELEIFVGPGTNENGEIYKEVYVCSIKEVKETEVYYSEEDLQFDLAEVEEYFPNITVEL